MATFKSQYANLQFYVGNTKAHFVNGLYATEDREVIEVLRKQSPYVEEVLEEKAEDTEVEKPVVKKTTARKATSKKVESAE